MRRHLSGVQDAQPYDANAAAYQAARVVDGTPKHSFDVKKMPSAMETSFKPPMCGSPYQHFNARPANQSTQKENEPNRNPRSSGYRYAEGLRYSVCIQRRGNLNQLRMGIAYTIQYLSEGEGGSECEEV